MMLVTVLRTPETVMRPAAMLKQLIGNHSSRAATRCVGVGIKGPIELRETKDLFVVSIQNPGIGVNTILEKLAVNK